MIIMIIENLKTSPSSIQKYSFIFIFENIFQYDNQNSGEIYVETENFTLT